MPMFRQVLWIMFFAASIEDAFRSGSFVCAMSCNCVSLMVPTTFCGVPDPFCRPAAFNMSLDAGGVLRMKVNDLSCKATI